MKAVRDDLQDIKGSIKDVNDRVTDYALKNEKALGEARAAAEAARVAAVEASRKMMDHERECLRERTRAARNVWGPKEWVTMLTGLALAAATLIASLRGMKAAESPAAAGRQEQRDKVERDNK